MNTSSKAWTFIGGGRSNLKHFITWSAFSLHNILWEILWPSLNTRCFMWNLFSLWSSLLILSADCSYDVPLGMLAMKHLVYAYIKFLWHILCIHFVCSQYNDLCGHPLLSHFHTIMMSMRKILLSWCMPKVVFWEYVDTWTYGPTYAYCVLIHFAPCSCSKCKLWWNA